MSDVIYHGYAHGGVKAAYEAVKLWTMCAQGNAEATIPIQVAAPWIWADKAARGLDPMMFGQHDWLDAIESSARKLLDLLYEAEGGNRACASVDRGDLGEVILRWSGTWTAGRWIDISLARAEGSGEIIVAMSWHTGTCRESTFLGLPAMTDEADKPEDDRRPDGWCARDALEDTPGRCPCERLRQAELGG